jgi:hypothetical protein
LSPSDRAEYSPSRGDLPEGLKRSKSETPRPQAPSPTHLTGRIGPINLQLLWPLQTQHLSRRFLHHPERSETRHISTRRFKTWSLD